MDPHTPPKAGVPFYSSDALQTFSLLFGLLLLWILTWPDTSINVGGSQCSALGWVEHSLRRMAGKGARWEGARPWDNSAGHPLHGSVRQTFQFHVFVSFGHSGRIQLLPRAEEAPGAILVLARSRPLKCQSPRHFAAGWSPDSVIAYFLSLLRQQPVPFHSHPSGDSTFNWPNAQATGCVPCLRTSHIVTDLWAPGSKLSRKIGFPGVSQCLHSSLGLRVLWDPTSLFPALQPWPYSRQPGQPAATPSVAVLALLSFIYHAFVKYIFLRKKEKKHHILLHQALCMHSDEEIYTKH